MEQKKESIAGSVCILVVLFVIIPVILILVTWAHDGVFEKDAEYRREQKQAQESRERWHKCYAFNDCDEFLDKSR